MQKKNFQRRDFLKLSAAGIASTAGIMMTKGLLANTNELMSETSTNNSTKMVYRTLGKTGLKVPIVSSGAIPVGNDNLARAIMKSGMVHIDTAHAYNEGKNEEALGKLLKEFKREDFIIATKVKGPFDWDKNEFTKEATTEFILDQFETSLKRLDLKYVDILYLHDISSKSSAMHEPTIKAFKQLKEKGKVRFVGLSTHKNQAEAIEAAIASNFYDVVLTGYNFKQDDALKIKAAIKKASEAGLGIVGMKVFAGHFWDKEKTKPIDRPAALKWALSDENLHTMLISFKSFDQIDEALAAAAKPKMTKKEKEKLEIPKNTTGLYCPGCTTCNGQCIHKLKVPEAMRAYMYAYGYSETRKARKLLDQIELSDTSCKLCPVCNVNCPMGFDVREKIMDVARLRNVPIEFLS